MEKALLWLNGKKAVLLSIASAVLSYAVATGLVDAQLAALLQTVLSVLAGGAVFATKDMLGKNLLGFRK